MAFNGKLAEALGKPVQGRISLAYKPRFHISKARADEFGMSRHLSMGDSAITHAREGRVDYINASNLTYDMLLSLYDFNSGRIAVARFDRFTEAIRSHMQGFVKSLKNPNLEARVLGLQDGHGSEDALKVLGFINSNAIALNEADLFGTDIRHISFETKRGMSMDLLLLDRVYRPGELRNPQTYEQFLRGELPQAAPQPQGASTAAEKPAVEPTPKQPLKSPQVAQPTPSPEAAKKVK